MKLRIVQSSTILRTWNGVLSADIAVKPTMSLKYMVTKSNASGSTPIPFVKQLATGLNQIKQKLYENIY